MQEAHQRGVGLTRSHDSPGQGWAESTLPSGNYKTCRLVHNLHLCQQLEGAESPAEDEDAVERCGRQQSLEEGDEDELEELPPSISRRDGVGRLRGLVSRKVSQTSVYLQEWDIPYEQLQLGELIGKVSVGGGGGGSIP